LALVCIGIFSWLILTRFAGRWWSLLGAVTVMVSPLVMGAAHVALSEAMFLAIALAWGYALLQRDKRGWLFAAGLGIALCLTRHAGAGLLVGAFVALRGRWRWVVAVPGLAALAVWMVFAGKGDHHVFLHNPLPDLSEMAGGFWVWLTPLMVLGFVELWKRARELAWAVIGWTVMVVGVMVFIDIGDTGTRMIIPAVTLLTLGAFCAEGRVNRAMVLALTVFLFANSRAVAAAPPDSLDFNSKAWRQSRAIKLLTEQAPDSLMFSNAADGYWYATGRRTRPLPRTDGVGAKESLPAGQCYVVYFKSYLYRRYYSDQKTWEGRVDYNRNGADSSAAVYDLGDAWVLRLR
jgi:MFS family permease